MIMVRLAHIVKTMDGTSFFVVDKFQCHHSSIISWFFFAVQFCLSESPRVRIAIKITPRPATEICSVSHQWIATTGIGFLQHTSVCFRQILELVWVVLSLTKVVYVDSCCGSLPMIIHEVSPSPPWKAIGLFIIAVSASSIRRFSHKVSVNLVYFNQHLYGKTTLYDQTGQIHLLERKRCHGKL